MTTGYTCSEMSMRLYTIVLIVIFLSLYVYGKSLRESGGVYVPNQERNFMFSEERKWFAELGESSGDMVADDELETEAANVEGMEVGDDEFETVAANVEGMEVGDDELETVAANFEGMEVGDDSSGDDNEDKIIDSDESIEVKEDRGE